MQNLLWYLGLAIFGVVMGIIVIYKNRKEVNIFKLIAFFWFTASITYIGEFVALVVFYAYSYKIGVFKDPFADSLVAHLLINATLWPATAILVSCFSLGYGWISLITGIYVLIEIVFLRLGIYEHRQWNLLLTAVLVFIFLVITKWSYNKLKQNKNRIVWYIIFYFIATNISRFPLTILLLLGKQHYSLGLVDNMYRDSSIFAVLYHTGMSLFYVLFVCIPKKFYWKLIPIIIYLTGDIILINLNILNFQDNWNLFFLTLIRTLSLCIFILLYRYTLETDKKKNGNPGGI